MSASGVRVEPLAPSNASAWSDLFARSASPCFCRYWHFGGSKNEWLGRCAAEPEANLAEMQGALVEGRDDARGLVAMDGERALGWMKLTPRAAVSKLRSLPVYRAVDLGDDAGVWSIGCLLIDPEARGRRIARALVEHAPEYVAGQRGRVLEAYPRHMHETTHGRLSDEEAMMGPEELFVSLGFLKVDDARLTGAYPVYRLVVGSRQTR